MEPHSQSRLHARVLRWWLIGVAFLVFLMVIVGGATRLTESGLSIVEWKPVTGTLPPLSTAEWQAEFDKYKAIPQYQLINRGMSLDEFKTIFWWEWGHRLLGRAIGFAFLVPFLFFLWRGYVARQFQSRLWFIFGLGALQGVVGWWMVYSGLADRTEVSQYRLATHLVLACIIFVAMVWTSERLLDRKPFDVVGRIRGTAGVLVGLVLVQIYLGGLVAGLRAGLTLNTWPLIDGQFIPAWSQLSAMQPEWRNVFENALTVQFNHRMMGYALWLASIVHVIDVIRSRSPGPVLTNALMLAGGITIQAVLGILTLIYQVPIGLALAHQGVAVLVLAVAVVHVERITPRKSEAPIAVAAAAPAE